MLRAMLGLMKNANKNGILKEQEREDQVNEVRKDKKTPFGVTLSI